MLFFMKLKPQPFEMIKKGRKIYELRLFDEKRSLIKIGDGIEFSCTENEGEKLVVEVVDILKYPSFTDLYADLSPLDIGYSEENAHLASHKDMEKYYSLEEQAKFGVVAIKIKLKKI